MDHLQPIVEAVFQNIFHRQLPLLHGPVEVFLLAIPTVAVARRKDVEVVRSQHSQYLPQVITDMKPRMDIQYRNSQLLHYIHKITYYYEIWNQIQLFNLVINLISILIRKIYIEGLLLGFRIASFKGYEGLSSF